MRQSQGTVESLEMMISKAKRAANWQLHSGNIHDALVNAEQAAEWEVELAQGKLARLRGIKITEEGDDVVPATVPKGWATAG